MDIDELCLPYNKSPRGVSFIWIEILKDATQYSVRYYLVGIAYYPYNKRYRDPSTNNLRY